MLGGIGGSMHLTDKTKGFIMSTTIVANSIPVGVGLSLSQKLEKKKILLYIFLVTVQQNKVHFMRSIILQL